MTTHQRSARLRPSRILGWLALCVCTALLMGIALLWWQAAGVADRAAPPGPAEASEIARGKYLSQIGNCSACHSPAAGPAYAGGRGIVTPFGTVYSSNLTPDAKTGIGDWSSEAFWRAMHQGRSRDGSLLNPAFPYTNTTQVTRADSDAILAYLRSLPSVEQANRDHDLRFPYNSQLALAAWRLLYFRAADPAEGAAQTSKAAASPEWTRGAYLVNGLGHCSACHTGRNALGGSADILQLDGGILPGEAWYAPSLLSADEAGVGDWPEEQIVALLKTGVSDRGSVLGPMAEVVLGSTQHLTDADAAAMAVYLKSLGAGAVATRREVTAVAADAAKSPEQLLGAGLYADHCADCHGKQGEGRKGAYPALAGNRAVVLDPPVNLLQIIRHGAFAPSTAGNPRPFGMPPFGLQLSQTDIAVLMTYLRSSWGHQASAVQPRDVQRWMESPASR